jgi:hypothetical protein
MRIPFRSLAAIACIAGAPLASVAAQCGTYSQVISIGTIYFGRLNAAPANQGAIAGTAPDCARQAFLTGGLGLGLVAGTDNLESHSFNLAFAGTSVTGLLTGSGNDGGFETTAGPPGNNGRYATSGLWSYYDDGTFTITTTPGVNGFGFYGTDVGDQIFGHLRVTYDDVGCGGSCDYTYNIPGNGLFNQPYGNGNLFFLGLILNSGTVSQIDFNANLFPGMGGDTPGYDDFTILAEQGVGTTLTVNPEPATMTLMATGLAGLVGVARRRRKG